VKAVILVPFRTDAAKRARNWKHARKQWEKLGLPIFEGNTIGGFQRAEARNNAARAAGDWNVALYADADIILGDLAQALAALLSAEKTGQYTVAYSKLSYLSERGTQQVVSGLDPLRAHKRDNPVGLTWECCFAVRRDIFDHVGGFDERFQGWGGQVAAFFYAYATFGGRERVFGDAYHLDHPLVDRTKDPHFKTNCALAGRYNAAVDDKAAMTEILKERQ
jgi:hypothetical protein